MSFSPRSHSRSSYGFPTPRLERPTAPRTDALRWKAAGGGALPASSYPQQASGNRSEDPNPKRTTFVHGPVAGAAGENDSIQQPIRTSDAQTPELLRSLTIRELIIQLGKTEDAVRSSDPGRLSARKTTRREQEIIEELHRRRDEFGCDPDHTRLP